MLSLLKTAVEQGQLAISDLYVGHLKKVNDEKCLAHASAIRWERVDSELRSLLLSHLNTLLDGEIDRTSFACHYKPDLHLAVVKVAPPDFDQEQNRPAVEILEAMCNVRGFDSDRLVQLGNVLSYKVMAAGAVRNEMLILMRFQWRPGSKAEFVPMIFGTILRLDDRYESLLDEQQGCVVTTELLNVVKRGPLKRGVLFPCLGDDLKEAADLLVYTSGTAKAWFKALEVEAKAAPKQEGKALMKLIADQAEGDPLPPDFLDRMGTQLKKECPEGLAPQPVARALEQVVGRGINQSEFEEGWTREFGSADYRVRPESLFHAPADSGDGVHVKLEAGAMSVTLPAGDLKHFRQVVVGSRNFLVMEVPEKIRVAVTRNRRLSIKESSMNELVAWMQAPTREHDAAD